MFTSTTYITLILTLFVTCTATAQQNIVIGQEHTLYAPSLQEDKTIQIYLPASYYNPKISPQYYPVVYVLDGESNFNYLTAYVEKLSKYPYPSIPEMIVVGIKNTNRTRDLTPTTPDKSKLSVAQRSKISGETGGNDKFFQFIDQTLLPHITNEYRTSGYNVLIGHSFGGITTLNYLLHYGQSFQAYIVHDPSIWWDNQWMLNQYKAATNTFNAKRLFITQADEKGNSELLSDHYNSIQQFKSMLDQKVFEGLQYQYKQYEGEDHGSIPLKGNLDGLRYIFAEFQFNFKVLSKDTALLQQHYEAISRNLNHTFIPNEAYLQMIIAYYTKNNEIDTALQLTRYMQQLYPINTSTK